MALITIAGWVAMAAALAGAVYAILATRALAGFFKQPPSEPSAFPAVTLLKPLHGAEAGLMANLESFCRQDYPGAIQIVCGVQATDDPAIAIVDVLRTKYPNADIALTLSARAEGSNPKIANLAGMVPSAKHGIVVLSDSDIGVNANYLRNIVAALEAPGVGAVTCLYTGLAENNPWSRLAGMGIDYQFLPNVAFAVTSGLAAPCFGSTIALRTSVLRDIGGFESFRTHLADDYEIGRAVRGLGLRLAYPPMTVSHTCTEAGLGALFRHELRWARTIRTVDGAGHAGSAVTHILPLGFLGVLLLGPTTPALAALGLIAAARIFQKLRIDHILGRGGPSLWLLPVRDMLSLAVFVGSFFTKQVDWRGRRYQVDTRGALARD